MGLRQREWSYARGETGDVSEISTKALVTAASVIYFHLALEFSGNGFLGAQETEMTWDSEGYRLVAGGVLAADKPDLRVLG